MAEFVDGFQFLADYKKTVSMFGSTRFKERNHHYAEARQLAKRLAKDGFTIVTGGGQGIMEAANRGAVEGGGESLGLNIQLPHEQKINPYVQHSTSFHYFFTRKVMLDFAAEAYVFFPGGYGTLDEFFELIELVQTKKIKKVPILLVGRDFWAGLIDWFTTQLYEQHHSIDRSDLEIFRLVDSIDEAYALLKDAPENDGYVS
ncbi:TIGR00730 family Rossman fold protein [Patescibacteria group bacterium]|nr:TIGR00730 family Rossman fold protein [Patescibacteria group bacterium]